MDKKPFWKSKSLWGFVVALISQVGILMDQHFGTSIVGSPALAVGLQILTVLGTVVGAYGRVVAKAEIK